MSNNNDYSNKLIYGKNNLDRIVAIEPKDDVAVIFRELEDGTIDIVEAPHRYWMLSNKQHSDKWNKLVGDQYYKFGKQYSKAKEYWDDKKQLKKRGADIYAIGNNSEACMVKDGYTFFKGMYHNKISVLSWDIETTGLEHNEESKVLLISNTFRSASGEIERKLFCYDDYENCADMLDDWAAWVCHVNPSLIIGHNIYCYDLPYINYCYSKYAKGSIILGRENQPLAFANYESKKRIDGGRELSYFKASIYGRSIIDTMFLAFAYDAVEKKYESYGLKAIIKQENLEKTDRVFYDAGTIRHNYKNPDEWAKIKLYAMDDADDALSLYDLMVAPIFYLTQSVPKPFQLMVESATGSQINSVLVRGYLQDKRAVAKAYNLKKEEGSEDEGVEGGISFAVPGIYRNVSKVDIKSCYPSQVLRFKLHSKDKDPDAYYFKLVEYFTLQRFEYKKLMIETGNKHYKNLDATAKIFINSAYGVANTNGLNYNDDKIAEKITAESRAVINMALLWASGKDYKHWNTKFYDGTGEKEEDRRFLSIPVQQSPEIQHDFLICPTDTDSISFCKADQSLITEEERKHLLTELNSLSPDKILWEDDGYFEKVIAIKAKNYVLFDGKKIKVKGNSLKATIKCPAMKELLKKFVETMVRIDDQEVMIQALQDIYKGYMLEIHNGITDIKRWCVRKTYTSKLEDSERANETKVMDAIKGTDYREGDRFYTFYKSDDTICLAENYNGDYNKKRLFKNMFDTISTFDTILPIKDLFINYELKRNQKHLPGYIEPVYVPKPRAPRKKKNEPVGVTQDDNI
jgi:DNA polymerase elongation subunit (family B)